jgi:hypothetical protein
MASTYTVNSGIEKPGTGEQSGTWGATTNTNFDIIDRVLNGVGTLTLTGTTTTLSTSDGSLSDGHYRVLVLGGSPSGTNTITISPNDQSKFFAVYNGSGQSAVFTQGSGGNATIANGDFGLIYANGAGAGSAVTLMAFPVTSGQIAADAVATAKIADSAVTSAKIADGTIVAGDMADDAVTAAKLASDAVVNASVASGAAIAFSKMANLTTSRALVSDGNGDVSVSAVTSTEIGYLDGVTSNVQTQINNIAGYPQVITVLTSGSSYSIPSGAQAVLIRASGGGGSGGSSQFSGNYTTNGNVGGDTTVSNSTLSISITAKGGASGRGSTGGTASVQTGDSGGDVQSAAGAAGGAPGMNNFDISCSFGGNGNLVTKYVTGSNVGGETLTLSIGGGGSGATAGSTTSAPGQTGFVEIWVW